MAVILDITELAQNPMRTGIQRVVRELIRHWPDPDGLKLARFDRKSNDLKLIPQSATAALIDSKNAVPIDHVSTPTLHDAKVSRCPKLSLAQNDQIFVPEVFFDSARCEWYRRLLRRNHRGAAFLLYDFIPWLFPHFYVFPSAPLMPYLQLVRDAAAVAFISTQTRIDYANRIRRDSRARGPVLPLGADGLSLERQTFDTAKRTWVSIGSIDGRKNQDKIVRAFHQLWANGFDGRLVLIGRVFEHSEPEWLNVARPHRNFKHISHVPEAEVAAELSRARATIYVSSVEGFGLPPVESLYSGIPAIVTSNIPSIQDIAGSGQVRLDSADPDGIAAAVSLTADDGWARRLWDEAATLTLGRWADFAEQAFRWITSIARLQPGTLEETK